MAAPLQIRRFDEIPSAEEFASQIESKNAPAVITSFCSYRVCIIARALKCCFLLFNELLCFFPLERCSLDA